jgi:hypothetical protein
LADLITIQDWQFFQGLYGFIGAAVGSAVLITIFIIRLEGKVKLLEKLLNEYKQSLDRQRDEISDLTKLFRNVGIQFLLDNIKKGEDGGRKAG